jgi:hypothetical protein
MTPRLAPGDDDPVNEGEGDQTGRDQDSDDDFCRLRSVTSNFASAHQNDYQA